MAYPVFVKAVFLSHNFPSEQHPSVGTFVADQAVALTEFLDVSVLAGTYERGPGREARHRGLRVRYLPLPKAPERLSGPSLVFVAPIYLRKALQALDGERPDIIHAHYGFPDGVVGVRLARMLGVPCVVTLHGSDANRQLRRRLVGPRIAGALARADAVVCVSRTMQKETGERFPALGARLVAIPNGYDDRVFSYSDVRPRTDFLFVGRLEPVKNPDLLVRAYARIAGSTERRLVLVGDGSMGVELRALARELGVEDRVVLAGTLSPERVNEALSSAGALVLPSRSEGMPIVVLEAMGAGVPVVASEVGGLGEVIEEATSGILVPPGDVGALAAAMLQADQRVWDRHAIARSVQRLSWRENALKTRDLYERVSRTAERNRG